MISGIVVVIADMSEDVIQYKSLLSGVAQTTGVLRSTCVYTLLEKNGHMPAKTLYSIWTRQ